MFGYDTAFLLLPPYLLFPHLFIVNAVRLGRAMSSDNRDTHGIAIAALIVACVSLILTLLIAAELEFVQWLMGDPLFGYNLNITVGEHTHLGLSEFGLGYAPSRTEVRCDVSRPGGAGRTPVACPHNHRREGSHADSSVSDGVQ